MRKDLIFHDCEQKTDEWYEVRRGKITGSKAAPLLTNPSKGSHGLSAGSWTIVEKVAGEILSGESSDSFEGNFHTRRGNDLEPLAKQYYSNYYFVDVEDVGFIEWPNEMAGCSPDGGVVAVKNKGLEVKCLCMQKHIHWLRIKDAINPTNQDQLASIIDKKHYAQIQWNLYVTQFDEWDLLHFHPKAGKGKMDVVKILPNPKYIERFEVAHAIAKNQVSKLVEAYKN